jgi:hypothetical protein
MRLEKLEFNMDKVDLSKIKEYCIPVVGSSKIVPHPTHVIKI